MLGACVTGAVVVVVAEVPGLAGEDRSAAARACNENAGLDLALPECAEALVVLAIAALCCGWSPCHWRVRTVVPLRLLDVLAAPLELQVDRRFLRADGLDHPERRERDEIPHPDGAASSARPPLDVLG